MQSSLAGPTITGDRIPAIDTGDRLKRLFEAVVAMCLAVPGKIVSIDGDHARIEYRGGVVREANVKLVAPVVGQYVIVHAGFAIQILKEEEALENLSLWDEMLEAYDSDGGG